jgi:hypothetical protein
MEVVPAAGMEVHRFNDTPEAVSQSPPSHAYYELGYVPSRSSGHSGKGARYFEINDAIGISDVSIRKSSRQKLWIIGIVVLIVILAGGGGAIGGVLAHNSSKKPTHVQ